MVDVNVGKGKIHNILNRYPRNVYFEPNIMALCKQFLRYGESDECHYKYGRKGVRGCDEMVMRIKVWCF